MMSGYNNVQLKGLDLFVYLMKRFGNTPEQALETMKARGLFDDDVATVHEGVSNYMKLKQKGNNNETTD